LGTSPAPTPAARRSLSPDALELLEWFPDAVAEADIETQNLTFVNHLFTDMTCYTMEDVTRGVSAIGLFDQRSQMLVLSKLQGHLAASPAEGPYQRSEGMEYVPIRAQRKDGSWFAGEVHGAYVLGPDLQPVAVRFVIRDLEDNASLQQLLDQSRQRWETLRRVSPVGVFHMAPDGRFTEVNEALVALTGMTVDRLLGHGYMQAIHPEDFVEAAAGIERALTAPDPSRPFRLECRLRYPEDGTRWVQVDALGERDGEGRFSGFVGTVTDVTERVNAQDRADTELKQSEELVDLILANTAAVVAIADEEGRILRCNPAAAALTGYSEAELLQMKLSDLAGAPLRPPADGPLRRTLRGEPVAGMLAQIRRKDGGLRQGQMTSTPVYLSDGSRRSVVTFLDLTERIEAEARAIQGQRLETLGLLAASIAHDFNNLLMVISASASLARMEDSGAVTEELTQIEAASDRAAELVRNLMSFTRREPVDLRDFDVNAATVQLRPILQRLLGRNVEIDLQLCPEQCTVFMNPGQFDQVLMNLAANARDAMRRGGSFTITTARQPQPEQAWDQVVITVTDTGTGMDEETRARLFEPLYTTKPEGEGTGLGLATVHRIVETASGDITVESAQGEATTFTITLPCKREGTPTGA
jgi:two-component system, cell cycle sensor histidine kinase and response regulator CckA